MNLFDVDIDTVIWQGMPSQWRHMAMYAWLRALGAPVVYLQGLFNSNRANNLYRLAHNGQVCFLTAALNDIFDPVDRSIYITDGPYEEPLYTYIITEEHPLWLGLVSEEGAAPYPDPQPLYTIAETVTEGYQFIVHVPVAAEGLPGYSLAWLRSVVDEYKLPGKSYNVVYF